MALTERKKTYWMLHFCDLVVDVGSGCMQAGANPFRFFLNCTYTFFFCAVVLIGNTFVALFVFSWGGQQFDCFCTVSVAAVVGINGGVARVYLGRCYFLHFIPGLGNVLPREDSGKLKRGGFFFFFFGGGGGGGQIKRPKRKSWGGILLNMDGGAS